MGGRSLRLVLRAFAFAIVFCADVARADDAPSSLLVRVRASGAPETWIVHVRVSPGEREFTTNPDRIVAAEHLSAGEVRVTAWAAGFRPSIETLSLAPGERREITVSLAHAGGGAEADVSAGETTVTAEAPRAATQMTLRADEYRRSPGALVPDLSRAFQFLPGVTASANLDARPYVEGGNPDELLYLVDGVFMPFPFHFRGVASLLNPFAFEKADLYAAGYPGEFGQALSGVVFADLREGGETLAGEATLSPVEADARASGPWGDGEGGWMVSARRTAYDLLVSALEDAGALSVSGGGVTPFFYDLESTVTRRFAGGTHDLRLSSLFTEEVLDLPDVAGAATRRVHNNGFVSLRWRGPLPGGGVGEARVTGNRESDVTRQRTAESYSDFWALLLQFQSAVKASYALPGGNVLDLGHHFDHAEVESESVQQGDVEFPLPVTSVRLRGMNYNGSYVQDSLHLLGGTLRATAALRIEHFSPTDETTYGPRASIEIRPSDGWTAKAAWGRYSQFPRDPWWLTVDPTLRAPESVHYVLSLERVRGRTEGKVQAYWKESDGLVGEYFGLGAVADGRGRAYGVELSLLRRGGEGARVSGTLTYGYGISRQQPEGAGWRWANHDQRHAVAATGTWRIGAGWSAMAAMRFRTGRPYTEYAPGPALDSAGQPLLDPLTGLPKTTLYPGPWNAKRMPPWHQLDLRLDREWKFRTWTLGAYVMLQNVYARRNVFQVQYAADGTREEVSDFPTFPLPLLGLSAEF